MRVANYKNYKDSGVEWLGKVPKHWDINRFKHSIANCKNGIWGEDARQDENDITCVRVADFDRQKFTVRFNQPTIRNVIEKDRNNRLLKKGNLLIEKSGGGELQPVGCVVLYENPIPAVCSNFIARLEIANGMNPSFWCYVHAAAYATRLTTRSINQTSGIQNLDHDKYFNELVAFPPIAEQNAIATFLDQETSRIDVLIVEQERLIDLLKEKRQAIISHAVTKGVNPDASMKDSEMEWLGLIPRHWKIIRLRFVIELNPSKSEINQVDKDTLVSFLPMDSINVDGSLYLNQERTIQEVETGYTFFRNGDVTIAKITPCFENGKGAVMQNLKNGIGFGTTELIVIRPIMGAIQAQYLHWLFISTPFMTLGKAHMYGAGGQKRVPDDFILNFQVGIPSIAEQNTISKYLDSETRKIDALVNEAQKGIELLQERRKALIFAAVTGKIDVRKLSERNKK